MSYLRIEGLSKHFGGLMAVNNLDLEVEKGEIVGLIGPNGSGKTTFLNLLTGFLKHNSGKIIFKGPRRNRQTALLDLPSGGSQDFPIDQTFS